MCSLFCCLSKSPKRKNDSDNCECTPRTAKKFPSRKTFASDLDSGDYSDSTKQVNDANAVVLEEELQGIQTFNETTDRSVTCTFDTNSWQSSADGQASPSQINVEILESTNIPVINPIYSKRVFGDNEAPPLETEAVTRLNHPKGERTTDKNCDNLGFHIGNLLRRMVRPTRWPRTVSEETAGIALSTFDNEHLKRFRRQLVDRQSRGKARSNTSPPKEVLPLVIPEISEVPLSEKKTDSYPAKSDLNKKPESPNDLGDSRGGQGDAFKIPNHVMYAPTNPGKHHIEPQVFPVFSWSVPVYRTRLQDGVSFTFGSAQPGTSSEVQQNAQMPLLTTPISTDTCPTNPTPMEVDDPLPPDRSLLNQLVQLTSTSPVDNQLMVQQLKEDMQKQLELQMQRHQQEVEARLQLGAAPASQATPKEHVMFCEWTLVLRYPVDRKVADRPMGILGHEPLRNYTLKQRSASNYCGADQHNWPDSPHAPNQDPAPKSPNYEPVPLCPQPDPGKNEPPPVCPQPDAGTNEPPPGCPQPDPGTNEPPPVCPQPDPLKAERKQDREECHPAPGSHSKDTFISEPTPVSTIPDPKNCQLSPQPGQVNESDTRSTQAYPVKSEPAQVCLHLDPKKSESAQNRPQPDPKQSKSVQVCLHLDPKQSESAQNHPQPDPKHSETAQVCPYLNPKQSEPAQNCSHLNPTQSEPVQNHPQPDPKHSETAQVCSQPDPVESEPMQTCSPPDSVRSEPTHTCPLPNPVLQPDPGSEPDPSQIHSVDSEPASHDPNENPDDCTLPCSSQKSGSSDTDPKKSQACPVGEKGRENHGVKSELSDGTIFIKKPPKKHVTIQQEELDDNYDVF